ncbi:hypothetical protein DERP_004150 [Dermatophagoides pteronyssinus]|uniref:Uncharacterized protein n=1 Tax=Dermatophagoides pteronyssinus TaxID=6956 RepID=A0ABQ8J8D1_DERPT|nr:hypothetical protein DERP_004150 [Dermatophagoides pteronyssinus]
MTKNEIKRRKQGKKKSCFAVYMRIGDTCLACQSKPKKPNQKSKESFAVFFLSKSFRLNLLKQTLRKANKKI